jgi:hypothetical protein
VDKLGDIGQEIHQEYEAIALALDALGFMLRKTKDTAFLMHVSMVAKPQQPESFDFIMNTVCSQCRSQLRQARAELGKILEWVGEDRNAWDAVTETEAKLTNPAFEAMRERQAPSGESGGGPGPLGGAP